MDGELSELDHENHQFGGQMIHLNTSGLKFGIIQEIENTEYSTQEKIRAANKIVDF